MRQNCKKIFIVFLTVLFSLILFLLLLSSSFLLWFSHSEKDLSAFGYRICLSDESLNPPYQNQFLILRQESEYQTGDLLFFPNPQGKGYQIAPVIVNSSEGLILDWDERETLSLSAQKDSWRVCFSGAYFRDSPSS